MQHSERENGALNDKKIGDYVEKYVVPYIYAQVCAILGDGEYWKHELKVNRDEKKGSQGVTVHDNTDRIIAMRYGRQ